MIRRTSLFAALATLAVLTSAPAVLAQQKAAPVVLLKTTMGPIEIQLDPARAPRTVRNFLTYVRAGFYNGTVFHRVIPGFMIQGGGFTPALQEKKTRAPIPNEADNGLKNVVGTIAMARTSDPNSATAQFFINTVTNPFLDFKSKTPAGWGYAVFGHVIHGMRVVHRIEGVPTTDMGPFQNVPVKPVVITQARVLQAAAHRPAKSRHQPAHP
ncbi:MAG TPA: peptidylprolyl isomerase [Acidiferrobacteraceae bacterium]|nr:peptidylprolyl isomerase [Acidiferrobacteraceae bacterium]